MIYAKPCQQKGFTLLEIMVALAIIAIVMAAAIRISIITTHNTAFLREKLISHWVAMNEAARLRLDYKIVPLGKQSGRVEMANRQWQWYSETTATADPTMHRIIITAEPAHGRKATSSLIIYQGRLP